MSTFDFYLAYKTHYEHFYGRPFTVTREEWAQWCRQPHNTRPPSDIEFDYAKERDGDAQ